MDQSLADSLKNVQQSNSNMIQTDYRMNWKSSKRKMLAITGWKLYCRVSKSHTMFDKWRAGGIKLVNWQTNKNDDKMGISKEITFDTQRNNTFIKWPIFVSKYIYQKTLSKWGYKKKLSLRLLYYSLMKSCWKRYMNQHRTYSLL